MVNKRKLPRGIMDGYEAFDTHFLRVAKDDPHDRLEVEVGDSKQSEFYPQIKIKRWDNEVNASFRLVDDEPKVLQTDGDKVKLVGAKKEVYLYELENGYEFEVILKEKPATNKIEFSVVDKGVKYFYQPELTQEEKDQGCVRPDNVIGSYAVYCSENKINWEGGKLYRVGKVGHIYRPKIIDSAGNEVWGELHIENGILSVTIPQDFLDKAVYPVRHAAGLTFGYTSQGPSYFQSGADALYGYRFTSPSDVGTANSISHFSLTVGAQKGVLVLQSSLNIVENGIGNAVSSGNPLVSSFATPPSLTPSTDYVLMFTESNLHQSYYDTGTSGYEYIDTTNSYASPTNPTDATTGDRKHSIYCTYEAAGSVSPSISPSLSPSLSPSISPSLSPSISPSVSPSVSLSPSLSPSISPSLSPSISPSVSPSVSLSPSLSPSISPSVSPSVSLSPSISPSPSPVTWTEVDDPTTSIWTKDVDNDSEWTKVSPWR